MCSFFETVAGHQFTEGTVPALIEAINRLAEAVEESNRLAKANGEEVIASMEKSNRCE